jgi:N-acetyl-gamma-glutamyl-phosphate reductase
MGIRVAVAGASGYAGGEMLRVLLAHPEARIGTLTAHSNAGTLLGAHQPHLRSLADRLLEPTGVDALQGHDVVVLALPHGASGAVAAELAARGDRAVVVDLGADHRLVDAADWEAYYGSEHAGTWPYGLPELLHAGERTASAQRAALAGATRIAVPGCNVTAVSLGLQPGIAAGLIEPTDLVAVLANGYSGAGRSLKTHLLASEALGSAQPYAVGGTHRHIPEIRQALAAARTSEIHANVGGFDAQTPTSARISDAGGADGIRISFTPVLVPMARGILATSTAPIAAGVTDADIRGAWEAAYGDETFVQLLPEGQFPRTADVLGANTALMGLAIDRAANRVVVVTAVDNLVKGTAGAAIQSMNIALGLPEGTALTVNGVAP